MTAREGLLGPAYFRHRRLIAESSAWSAARIAAYQEPWLARLRQRYGTALTTKDDYRDDPGAHVHRDLPVLTRTVRTGGTSGQPLSFRADALARRQKERAYLFDIWSRAGYQPHDLRVVYRGNVQADLLHFDRLENAWLVSPSATTEPELVRLRRWLRDLPPFFLHVYPSSLATFIDLVGDELFRGLPVRGVLAGSEGFPAGERARFEQDYGIPVAHWYGHSEYAVLAYCCRDCQGFHFYPTYGHVEFVPPDQASPDGLQRIVASSFNRVGTQFSRYETGDLAIPATGACADQFPRAAVIAGRSQEMFTDEAGRRRALGPYIFGIHGPFWDEVRDLQFVQDRAGHLRVLVAAGPAADTALIRQTLTRRMPMVTMDIEYVPRIERGANGKRRYFVDATAG